MEDRDFIVGYGSEQESSEGKELSLAERYDLLMQKKRALENEKLRLETQQESLTKQYNDLGKELFQKYGVRSLSEAEKKLQEMSAEVESILTEAERVFAGVQS